MQGGGSRMILRDESGRSLVDLAAIEPYKYFVGEFPILSVSYRRGKIEIEYGLVWDGHSNVMLPYGSGDTVLVLSPSCGVKKDEVLGLQSGEKVKVLRVLGENNQGVHVEVIRGYGRTVVRSIAKLDACWLLDG